MGRIIIIKFAAVGPMLFRFKRMNVKLKTVNSKRQILPKILHSKN